MRLAARSVALPPRLEPQPPAQPRPLRTDHRHDGTGEERDRKPAHTGILAVLNRRAEPADKREHELTYPRPSVSGLLGHSDARPLRPGQALAADLHPLWAVVRASRARRDDLLLRSLTGAD